MVVFFLLRGLFLPFHLLTCYFALLFIHHAMPSYSSSSIIINKGPNGHTYNKDDGDATALHHGTRYDPFSASHTMIDPYKVS